MATYVMSDIHGMYKQFIEMLGKINFNKEIDRLIILGDIINRGPDSSKMINWVIENYSVGHVEMLLGNHEDDYIRKYGCYQDSNQITIEFLKKLPLWVKVVIGEDTYYLVHAGLDVDNKLNIGMDESDLIARTVMLKSREFPVNYPCENNGFKIIFGHTPSIYVSYKAEIMHFGTDLINIDCGASVGGSLACVRLDDMKEYYIKGDDML